MRTRTKNQCVKVGELGTFIREQEERRQKIFGELVGDIMREKGCTWTEAKRIFKHKRVERAIAREMSKI